MTLTFKFDKNKNEKLNNERGVSFEKVITLIEEGSIVDITPNPNYSRYPEQMIYFLNVSGYVYSVPFVRKNDHIFLKTIYPSRKATREYLGKKPE